MRGPLTKNVFGALERLQLLNAKVVGHWKDGAEGWAPEVASLILKRSRLDRHASLCACLEMWVAAPQEPGAEGKLILAWVHLGALVEGTLKLFVSVYAHDYGKAPTLRKGMPVDPDALSFEQLRQLFMSKIWLHDDRTWDVWLAQIQFRRNAIHAYQDRDLGTHAEFLSAIVKYAEFAERLDSRLPYYQF